MPFNIKHGGYNRPSFPLASTETNTWEKGRVLMMNSAGAVLIHDGSAAVVTGLALEKKILSTSVGPTTTVTKLLAPSGEKYSMVVDEAVVIDDQIRSGINFEPGNAVYTDTAGRLTTSGNGTGSNSPRLGYALSQGRSGDSARPLEFLFSVTY